MKTITLYTGRTKNSNELLFSELMMEWYWHVKDRVPSNMKIIGQPPEKLESWDATNNMCKSIYPFYLYLGLVSIKRASTKIPLLPFSKDVVMTTGTTFINSPLDFVDIIDKDVPPTPKITAILKEKFLAESGLNRSLFTEEVFDQAIHNTRRLYFSEQTDLAFARNERIRKPKVRIWNAKPEEAGLDDGGLSMVCADQENPTLVALTGKDVSGSRDPQRGNARKLLKRYKGEIVPTNEWAL